MTSTKRIEWIDYAKGLGIFSVVLLHILVGLVTAGIIQGAATITFIESWLHYSFNMPIFFFLGALFIAKSLPKTWHNFLKARLQTLVYPYFLWSLITLCTASLVSNYSNSGLTLSPQTLLQLLYDPIVHYWFLFTIFFVLIIYLCLTKLSQSPWVFFFFAFALYILGLFVEESTYWLWGMSNFTIFFAFGAIFAEETLHWLEHAKMYHLLSLAMAGFTIWSFFVMSGVAFAPMWGTPLAMTAGMLAVLAVAGILSRWRFFGIFNLLGRRSLEIYLVHILAGGSFRLLAFNMLGIESVFIHVVGGTLFGILIPLMMVWFAEKFDFPYLFIIPKSDLPNTPDPIAVPKPIELDELAVKTKPLATS